MGCLTGEEGFHMGPGAEHREVGGCLQIYHAGSHQRLERVLTKRSGTLFAGIQTVQSDGSLSREVWPDINKTRSGNDSSGKD